MRMTTVHEDFQPDEKSSLTSTSSQTMTAPSAKALIDQILDTAIAAADTEAVWQMPPDFMSPSTGHGWVEWTLRDGKATPLRAINANDVASPGIGVTSHAKNMPENRTSMRGEVLFDGETLRMAVDFSARNGIKAPLNRLQVTRGNLAFLDESNDMIVKFGTVTSVEVGSDDDVDYIDHIMDIESNGEPSKMVHRGSGAGTNPAGWSLTKPGEKERHSHISLHNVPAMKSWLWNNLAVDRSREIATERMYQSRPRSQGMTR